MGEKHKEPLPNIERRPWKPGKFTRSSEDPDRHEDFPGRNWDGRVKRIDVLGKNFPENVDYPESIENTGRHNHGAKSVRAPKPRGTPRNRREIYEGD
jgi:hypothetical protein